MRPPQRLLRAIALACSVCSMLLGAHEALAQASASLRLDSDYRFRGESFGGNRPSLRADVNYDAERGWYAGGSIARAEFAGGDRYMQATVYGGRVFALTPGLDLDTGANILRFSGGGYDFAEAYAGAIGREWSVRLNYSPNYFHQGVKTLYIDANAHHLLTPEWRVFAHAGELVRVSPAGPSASAPYPLGGGALPSRARWDVRAGLGWAPTDSLDLQLAWVRASRDGPVSIAHEAGRAAWVASAVWSF